MTTHQDEREKFEKWARPYLFDMRTTIDGSYKSIGTEGAWMAWQARGALANAPGTDQGPFVAVPRWWFIQVSKCSEDGADSVLKSWTSGKAGARVITNEEYERLTTPEVSS